VIGNADKHSDRSVLKVFDKTLDLHYAVKVFHKHSLVKRGRRCVKQTIEEARILRRAMEYLSGGELFDLWKRVLRVSHPLLRFLVSQVALALGKFLTHDPRKLCSLQTIYIRSQLYTVI
ncbi:hypothetical protein X801_05187, partial [Opisthorchis viverrini]